MKRALFSPGVHFPGHHAYALTQQRQRSQVRRWFIDATFLLPAVILFGLVIVYPVCSSLLYGFTDWNGISPQVTFVGLANFIAIFHDREVATALGNTFYFTIVVAIAQNAIALILALALSRVTGFLKLVSSGLRVLFLMPMLLSGLAIGYLSNYILSPNFGPLNALLTSLHLGGLTRDWLGDPHLALNSVIVASLWQFVGFNMIIFLAGLQSIPDEFYEAAKIDGASSWQIFRFVTWPALASATTISFVLTLIGGFKVFDIIYSMTGGGPGISTESLVMRVYHEGFVLNNYGYGAALGIVLTICIFVVSLMLVIVLRRREFAA